MYEGNARKVCSKKKMYNKRSKYKLGYLSTKKWNLNEFAEEIKTYVQIGKIKNKMKTTRKGIKENFIKMLENYLIYSM